MNKLLYVDACVNRDVSRTERLAQALLVRLRDEQGAQVDTLVLEDEPIAPLTGAEILRRTAGTESGDFDDPLFSHAKQFAASDEAIIAAPYWDFSFPSKLKVYLERLCAQGVTFNYSPEGVPTGLVNTKRVWYVTTAGGSFGDYDYGWLQVKAICELYFGVPDLRCFRAEGLDIVTNDADAIVEDALRQIREADLG